MLKAIVLVGGIMVDFFNVIFHIFKIIPQEHVIFCNQKKDN